MTDFGQKGTAGGATEDKQDDLLTALVALSVEISGTLVGLIDELETLLDTLHTDVATTTIAKLTDVITAIGNIDIDISDLTAQAVNTFVDNITFDADPTTYTATGIDVSAYRDFLLLISLAVANTPIDIVIRVEFSDDDSTYYSYMSGPFGDLRYEDAAGAKLEAIVGKCVAPYMRVYVAATGTNGTDTFTLTVKAVLTR